MPTPLTIQQAINQKFTALDLVGYFKPDWEPDESEFYLFNKTCFPLNLDLTIIQLNLAFVRTEYIFSLLNPEE